MPPSPIPKATQRDAAVRSRSHAAAVPTASTHWCGRSSSRGPPAPSAVPGSVSRATEWPARAISAAAARSEREQHTSSHPNGGHSNTAVPTPVAPPAHSCRNASVPDGSSPR